MYDLFKVKNVNNVPTHAESYENINSVYQGLFSEQLLNNLEENTFLIT